MLKILNFLFFYVICVFSLSALSKPLRVGKIIIQGNQIINKAAISSKITSRVFKNYRIKKVKQDVKNIFNTGWFYDVQVKKIKTKNKKITLIYKVKENPIIKKIIYKGNKHISKKELKKISNLSFYEFLNHKKIKKMIKDIQKEYKKKGYYLAHISYKTKKTSHNKKVNIIINIKENKKIKVKRINFFGNKSISSKKLKSFMSTKEATLLSFISSAGSYNKQALNQDLNNIRYIYMDKGYWKIFVGPPKITLSTDKTDLIINIFIEEGEPYIAGAIHFTADSLFDDTYLKSGLHTKESEVFSYGTLQKDIKWIQKQYGNKGYAFANIMPQFFQIPGDSSNILNVNFKIQKGKKVRIGIIPIQGNHHTRDKVIRRELKFFEGELYNETNKILSLQNLKRLGFFEEVKIIPKTIKNRDNKIDMEIIVKEKENTGTLEAGAGFNGYFGFSFKGKLQKFNFLGKGYTLSFDMDLNSSQKQVNFNFVDPYFLDSKWYFGVDFYLHKWNNSVKTSYFSACELYGTQNYDPQLCWQSFPTISSRGFSEKKISGGITLGRSLTDLLKILLYYRLENITLSNTIDPILFPIKKASGIRNPIEAIIEYDNRNDRYFATGGMYSRSSLSYDGLLGKFNYITFSTNIRFYQKLFWDLVFRVNVKYSQYFNLSKGTGEVPFDRLFLLGGINDLRGFKYFSIGPRKKSNYIYQKALKYEHPSPDKIAYRVFGGTKEFFTNIEIQFPIFPKVKLTGVAFIDIGAAYNKISTIDLRGNWGLGVRFFTPLGPIRLELGLPFNTRVDQQENKSEFNFTMGLPF